MGEHTKEYLSKEEILDIFKEISEYNHKNMVKLFQSPYIQREIKELAETFNKNRKIMGGYFRGIETRRITNETLLFLENLHKFIKSIERKQGENTKLKKIEAFFHEYPVADGIYDLFKESINRDLEQLSFYSDEKKAIESAIESKLTKKTLALIIDTGAFNSRPLSNDLLRRAKVLNENYHFVSNPKKVIHVTKAQLVAIDSKVSGIQTKLFLMKEKIIMTHMRLVEDCVKKFKDRGIDLDDIRQEALMGVLKASKRFDHRMNWTFSTYATQWINQKIYAICRSTLIVNHPVDRTNKAKKLNFDIDEFIQKHSRKPSFEEIMKLVKSKDEAMVMEILNLTQKDVSLQYSNTDYTGERNSLMATLFDDSADEELVNYYKVVIRDSLNELPDIEARALKLLYGIETEQELSRKMICEKLGVSNVNLKIIIEQGLERIRQRITSFEEINNV